LLKRLKLWLMLMLMLHSAQKQASPFAASRGFEQPSFQLGTEASRTGPVHTGALGAQFDNYPQNHYK
jgi:hypothetical protein